MAEQLVELRMIDPNPYQKRKAPNREKVVSIAFSIASDKMLQTPTGRWAGKRFQSAIGHTRTDAYRLNAEIQAASVNGKKYPKDVMPEHIEAVITAVAAGRDFATMPWVVEELTDEQMYRYATIENNQREDLSPIEKMEEMKGWVEFGYTSKQIAALYPGMSDATVRGLLSFDKLPQEAKNALHEGKISQDVARKLNSLQKIAPEAVVVEAVNTIIQGKDHWGDPMTPEAIIEEIIEDNTDEIEQFYSSRDGKPRSSHDGWLLDMKNFPNKYLPELTPVDAACALGIQNDQDMMEKIALWIQVKNGLLVDAEITIPEDLQKKIDHLLNPPACSTCPFHTIMESNHYCGMKVCFKRKEHAWDREHLHAASKKTGFAIYDPETDGREFRVLEDHYGGTNDHYELWKKKNKDLRLALMDDIGRTKGQSGYDLPRRVCALLVGETLRKLLTERHDERAEKRQAEQAIEARKKYIQQKCQLLAWEASLHIKAIFDGLNLKALGVLWETPSYGMDWDAFDYDDEDVLPEIRTLDRDGSQANQAELKRRAFVMNMIANEQNWHYKDEEASIEEYAAELVTLAKDWGVKLPKSITTMAKQFQAEIPGAVATETPKQKKGKK
ncbi:MAG TPA: hypothetical protein VHP14_17690 [Anaerolineales bacterium]|nr:hypothetical protein [Anaerolineales bacterium]